VAKIITMPTTPNFTRSSFRLFRAIGQTASPFTGKQLTQEFDAVFWEAEVSLPPLNREQAVEWQSFLMQLKGSVNHFKFADPDALTNQGTFNTTHLLGDKRINNTNVALTVTNTNTFTANASTFGNAVAGDFIHVTGLANEENNGTHKITTVSSATVVVVDSVLTNASSTSGCKVQQNVKGASALSLDTTSSFTGTIKKGDYLGITAGTATTANPVQLVQVVEDATLTDASPDKYSVQIEPKLRSDLADDNFVIFQNPKGLFRLVDNVVGWDGDQRSLYGISFACIEVV
tara:strand:- start:2096 stop:2962 length:867 start_codon:yes stop_codon:yes gene_type:complete